MQHTFSAELEEAGSKEDGYTTRFVEVPQHVIDALSEADSRRVIGSINGTEFRRALHPRANGTSFLMFGKGWLRDAGINVGDEVDIELEPDPDPDFVLIPEELEVALEFEPLAKAAWDKLTPGRQRSLAYSVDRAKRPETKVNRALAIAEKLREDAATS